MLGKTPRLGSGARFSTIQRTVARRLEGRPVPRKFQHLYGKRYTSDGAMLAGAAVAASIGRVRYGKAGMRRLSMRGRR